LLKTVDSLATDNEPSEMPNFNEMIQSIFTNSSSDKPDFVIRNRGSATSIYLDRATKLDIILSTVFSVQQGNRNHH
jgi:hypothetical protein